MAQHPQHPLFTKYTRDYLHRVTGFSKGYLSRLATGRAPVRLSFIARVCFALKERESDLFLPGTYSSRSQSKEKKDVHSEESEHS